jgi:cellulose synthase/poly-beta-1,6-N-acetylglucosamine synthase-like glycosyltransferase
MIVWSVLLALIACVWASRHMAISRAKREQIPLRSDSYEGQPHQPPMVTVLIAAKDEEDNIETAVRSMLDQDYPNFELIVINDRSSDRTADILESIRAGQPDGRLQVIHIERLREGWFGKNNAMREGVLRARGDWLCFGDADCRQTSKRTLSVAMRHALVRGIDFLSVLPRLETHSIWERIIQPVCGAVMVFWFSPERVNNPSHPAAYANGAFMLMSRSCYDAIGGHEAVRTEVNEDMRMGQLAKERGQRLFIVQNDDLYTVRMYSRFSQIWHGWSRIFYGCFGTFRRLRKTLLVLCATNLFPYLSLLIGAAVLVAMGWSAAGAGWQSVTGTAALAVAAQQTVIARLYRISYTDPRMAPTFIIGVVVCVGMLVSAMLKLNGRSTTTWRGTTYRGSRVTSESSAS